MPRAIISSLALSLCSALLLLLAFPSFGIWPLAWMGLVPLLIALDGKNKKQAFFLGYICGLAFFGGTLYWFIHVTLPGAILLIAYLAVYLGLFAVGCVTSATRLSRHPGFLLPSLWVALEFIRGKFLSGFGWVSLGHSQQPVLPLIQVADMTGVYGISFLLVMANVILKNFFRREKGVQTQLRIFLLILVSVLGYGFYQLKNSPPPPETSAIKISVVQGNIPQSLKWDRAEWKGTFEKYLKLTQAAVEDQPDLIIWPETAFPGYVWETPQRFEELKEFIADLQIPLLFGIVTVRGEHYHNSAMLASGKGQIVKEYHKWHLVPFGEYLPLRQLLPSFLEELVPIADFTSGKELTLFSIPAFSQLQFSVLICFEDTISYLARRMVAEGADFLVNITNDAWFQDTNAPFLHLQAGVFEAVQNRRPLVRAANTGVSSFIEPTGRLSSSIGQKMGRETYVEGHITHSLSIKKDQPQTFYTKLGDIFTYLCFLGILVAVIKKYIRSAAH